MGRRGKGLTTTVRLGSNLHPEMGTSISRLWSDKFLSKYAYAIAHRTYYGVDILKILIAWAVLEI